MGSRNPVDSQNHRKEEKTFLQENGVDLMIPESAWPSRISWYSSWAEKSS